MKVNPKNVSFFQEGGVTPAPAEQIPDTSQAQNPQSTPGQEGQDPLQQILQMFVQGLQNQDCATLAQGAQAFIQLVQQSQGGAGTSSEQPVYMKKGGKVMMKKKVAKTDFLANIKGKKEPSGNEPQNAKSGVKIKK